MKNNEFFKPKVGDTVWYANGKGLDKLVSGKCVNIFEHNGNTIYVLAAVVPGIGEYIYEVRDEPYISPGPNKPLNWIKNIRKINL